MKYSKLTLILTSLLLLAAGVFTACSDFDDMEIPTEELYTREFIKQFGVFDSNHNWNLATEGSITLSPQSYVNEAKVYARYDGKYYYVARAINCYKDVTLNFDVPSGVTDLKIVVDGTTYYAQSGTKILVGGGNSRSASRAETIVIPDADYTPSTKNSNIEYAIAPEKVFDSFGLWTISKKNGGILPEDDPAVVVGNSRIVEDFTFRAKKDDYITIYPLFWNTTSTHILGIYFVDDNGYFDWIELDAEGFVKPYTTNKNDVLYKDGVLKAENHFVDLWKSKAGTVEYQVITKDGTGNETIGSWTSPGDGQCSNPAYNRLNDAKDFDLSEDYLVNIKASGIKIRFKGNVSFGFFLKVNPKSGYVMNGATVGSEPGTESDRDYKHIFFSRALLNQYYGRVLLGGWDDDWKGVHYLRNQITETQTEPVSTSSTLLTQITSDYYGSIAYTASNGGRVTEGDKKNDVTISLNKYLSHADAINFNNEAWDVDNKWGTLAKYDFWQINRTYSKAVYLPDVEVRDLGGNLLRKRSYFCFEDWSNLHIDFNDLIFVVEELSLSVIDEGTGEEIDGGEEDGGGGDNDEPFEWVIAAEDLGTTDDFDFNDMVIKVTSVPLVDGSTYSSEMTLTALAAGGTLPIYLHFSPYGPKTVGGEDESLTATGNILNGLLYPHYNKTEVEAGNTAKAEWHQWFDNGYPSTQMLNTSNGTTDVITLRKCFLKLDGKFSLGKYSQVDAYGKFKGFYITVNEKDLDNVDPSNSASWTVKGSATGEAPQMFVVPNKDWAWPIERGHIKDAYNGTESFTGWANDKTTNRNWHKYPTGSTYTHGTAEETDWETSGLFTTSGGS